MKHVTSFIAIDLGASNGRVISAHWDGLRFDLEDLHRFSNGGVLQGNRLCWDVENIWTQTQLGMTRFSALHGGQPISVGVDAWGIDFGLLDAQGALLSNPVHYRDRRTENIPELLYSKFSEKELFKETGVQPWRINTLFQLYSMVLADDPQLRSAATLLTIPDLFSHFLCGSCVVEFTEATTTQMYSFNRRSWSSDLLQIIGIPVGILPAVASPGTKIGTVLSSVGRVCGFQREVTITSVASHDTASAVAAIPNMDGESTFISSGTWSLMGAEVAQPNLSEDARVLGFTNEGSAAGQYLLLKNLAGLWIIQECLRCWGRSGHVYGWGEIVNSAASTPPFRFLVDPNDRIFDLPPDMPAAVCEYCRRTKQNVPASPGEFARALFESLALKYKSVLSSLELLTGKRLSTIRIVGGGSRNELLCQMVADACNRSVVAGPAEATVLGNVMMQAVAMGHIEDLHQGRIAIAESCECIEYEPHPSAQWDEAYQRFEQIAFL